MHYISQASGQQEPSLNDRSSSLRVNGCVAKVADCERDQALEHVQSLHALERENINQQQQLLQLKRQCQRVVRACGDAQLRGREAVRAQGQAERDVEDGSARLADLRSQMLGAAVRSFDTNLKPAGGIVLFGCLRQMLIVSIFTTKAQAEKEHRFYNFNFAWEGYLSHYIPVI
jgi:hypothetical protein